jgi:4-amino-4-deoxy-L-arabinose transferase-like glycosyltransferase
VRRTATLPRVIAPDTPLRRRPPRPSTLLLALLVAVAVAVRLPLLGGAQIDYDEGVYWESLRSMAAGHPLFSSVYSSQPPGFLTLMSVFFAAGHSLVAARSGVLVFFAIALVATYATARSLLGAGAAIAAAALLAVDPLMLRQSVTLQADGPAVALGMVALACATAIATTRAPSSRRAAMLSIAAGVALALATSVKLNAVGFAVPVVLVIILSPGGTRPPLAAAVRRVGWMVAGVVAGAAAVLLPFAGRLHLVWSQSVGSHLTARSLQEGGLTHDMALALARESPFYLAALLGIAVLLWRAPRCGAMIAAWGATVAALTVTQRPLWPHHLVLAAPLVAIAAAAPVSLAWGRVSPRVVVGVAIGAAACLGAAGLATGLNAIDNAFTADTHPGAVAALRALTRPGDLVVTDDQFAAAAADRDTPPELVDTAYVRLDSQHVSAADVEAIARRDGVRAVYLATNRLVRLAGLLDWVRANYPHAVVVDGGGVVYTAS